MKQAMIENWQEIGFTIEKTRDQSPTLRFIGASREAMHHSGGALEESLYIYGEPAQQVFERFECPRIFSLGLGLGYNEWIVTALSLIKQKRFELVTMESEEALRRLFLEALRNPLRNSSVAGDLKTVCRLVAAHFGLTEEELRGHLKEIISEKRWTLMGALREEANPEGRFHFFMYDAFSGATSPCLWEEDFLTRFLLKHAEQQGMFATYACRGALKRALAKTGFRMIPKTGFAGKRECTLAYR